MVILLFIIRIAVSFYGRYWFQEVKNSKRNIVCIKKTEHIKLPHQIVDINHSSYMSRLKQCSNRTNESSENISPLHNFLLALLCYFYIRIRFWNIPSGIKKY